MIKFALILLPLVLLKTIPQSGIGVNLPPYGPASTGRMFTDLVKLSNPIYPQRSRDRGMTWGYENPGVLDRSVNGYPLFLQNTTSTYYDVSAVIEIGYSTGLAKGKLYPAGNYVLLYEGTGNITVEGDAQLVSADAAAKRHVVTITPVKSVIVRIRGTSPEDPVKNVRLVPEEYEATYATTNIFYPPYVDKIKMFKTLRFCGWQRESYNSWVPNPRGWENRTKTDGPSQNMDPMGIALEYMILLANQLNVNAWFCMPSNSDDDYVRNFAKTLNDTFSPTNQIYVEYSNTVGLVAEMANKTNNIADIFLEVFGDARRNSQIVVVAPARIWTYLMHTKTYFNNDFSKVDAIGLDGNFGQDLNYNDNYLNIPAVENLKKEEILEIAKNCVLLAQAEINRNIQEVKILGLSPISFAGGPFFQGPNYGYRFRLAVLKQQGNYVQNLTLETLALKEAAFAQVLIEVNRDPLIRELYLDYLRRWFVLGGMMYIGHPLEAVPNIDFNGYVTLMEDMNLPNEKNPKYLALVDYISGTSSKLPYTSADLPKEDIVKCDPECQWGTCYQNKCICFEGYNGAACTELTTRPNSCTNNLGINLAGLRDWSTEWTMNDLWKMSREWVTQEYTSYAWDTGKLADIPMRSDGYPASLQVNVHVAALMVRDLNAHYEKGTYVVLFDGDGVLVFGLDDVLKVRRFVGRVELDVNPTTNFNNGIFVKIVWTNPSDPVRNIRVLRPGYEKLHKIYPFHPLFLQLMERFSAFRFMDWMATNSQTDTMWDWRVTPNNRTYTVNGAPLEMAILLSNTLGVDMWINVPHKADDTYIEEMAKLVNSTLRPDVKVIVEYSNEVWGTLFPGGNYAQQEGLRANLSLDPTQARFCFLGMRTQNISAIWRRVFGDAGAPNRNRLQIVLSAQAVNADTSKRILACNDSYLSVDALAIAPYFGGNMTRMNTGRDADIVSLEELMTINIYSDIAASMKKVKEHVKVARDKGLKIFLYESGQSLVGATTLQNELAYSANRDSRMKDIYTIYLKQLKDAGIDLIMHFSSIGRVSKYGCWGLLENQDDDINASPKWAGVQEFILSTAKCQSFPTYTQCPNQCGKNLYGVCLKSGLCSCFYGRTGLDCSPIKYIDFFDCSYKCTFDQGVCYQYSTVGPNRYYKCSCYRGWSGAYCSLATCSDSCSYRGECVGPEKCKCYEGFSGDLCETDCGCNGHGVCDIKDGVAKCLCDPGFKYNEVNKTCEFDCRCSSARQKCVGPNECSCAKECKNGVCIGEKCQCYAGYGGDSCNAVTEKENTGTRVGINLAGVNDYTTQQAFLDLFKASRDWISQYVGGYNPSSIAYTWNTGEAQDLNDLRYPVSLRSGQALGTLMVRDLKGFYPAGNYIVLYDGSGLLNIGFDAKVLKARKGRIEIFVTPQLVRDNGIFLQILYTDPSNPVRNIRVVRTEYEFTFERWVFNKKMLQLLAMFVGIRFMDWAKTNGHTNSKWETRTKPGTARQSGENGVALEHMVKLANIQGADPWFCIPHMADDEYVRNYAQYVKDNLRSDLTIYVEYSNEVWNAFFLQGKYAIGMANQLGINPQQFYAKRSTEIFTIFENVFGAENRKRLVFILSTQLVSTSISKKILSYNNSYMKADALGLGYYFDCNGIGSSWKAARIPIMEVDQILAECEAAINGSTSYVEKQVSLARGFKLPVIMYEAGTAISEEEPIYTGMETQGATEKYIAANRHPKMKEIYYKALMRLKEVGAISKYPLFHFSSIGLPSKYGSWSVLEHFDQPALEAPKYGALLKFMANNTGKSYGRVGCTVLTALNYDKTAEVDQGCIYPPKKINSTGGELTGKKISIKIPAMALENGTDIELSETVNKSSKSIGVQYKLGPSGTQFKVPIQICIDILDEYTGENLNKTLRLFVSNDNEELIWNITNATTQLGPIVCGNLSHFSSVAVMEANLTNLAISLATRFHAGYMGLLMTALIALAIIL